ncbi:MAG: citramalate synthase [Calditrichae bacterium]|nr:citramalate synthase [Calditrichota bacterium]MCB9056934.1 citramalate synthase [Calditrichia bacterium]
MSAVYLYDTTLRDGTQREGISLSCDDKLKIAQKLDEFGIHYIEGGWPGSNPKDADFFRRVKDLNLKTAKISAFGSTRYKNTTCDVDANIQALVNADTPVVALVGKSWDLHVTVVLDTTLEENLAMIEESCAYFKKIGKEVIYDAEHFFDGYKANPDYTLATIKAAAKGGADTIVLCDTNGGTLPTQVLKIVNEARKAVDTPLGIHTHDDGGCAVANSLIAIEAGCNQVQGTINGYGERVANANLVSIIPNLQLKMGLKVVDDKQLKELTSISHYVAEVANLPLDDHQPFVGHSAFAHKGGIHVAAMLKAEESYQHIDPELIGNKKRMVVSELSGKGNLLYQAEQRGIDISQQNAKGILTEIKNLEYEGFTFEAAEASVDLMLRRSSENYKAPFELIDFMVVVEQREGRGLLAEATVKVRIGNTIKHTAAEGNGPVNALDMALRKALSDDFPQLMPLKLTDYKVRILNGERGTAATTRVLIDFHDGDKNWTTVGANENIIEASWKALSDSMEYALTMSDGK